MAAESKECNICGITKSIGNFSANRGACNKCRTSRNRDRQNSTVELFLGARLTSIKQRHKQKNYDGTLVSLEYLMDLYEQQRGICAISNIPMHTSTDYSDYVRAQTVLIRIKVTSKATLGLFVPE